MTSDSRYNVNIEINLDTILQLGRKAVRKAQEESRRLGVPNVYFRKGRLLYELPSGELTEVDPWAEKESADRPETDSTGQ